MSFKLLTVPKGSGPKSWANMEFRDQGKSLSIGLVREKEMAFWPPRSTGELPGPGQISSQREF